MAEINKKIRQDEKSERPVKPGHKYAQGTASATPSSTGGSRQGNIGHEPNEPTDNAHR